MINLGHVYKDQPGTIMDRGENTLFLVLGRSKPVEGKISEDEETPSSYQVLEIGEIGKAMGPISFQATAKLEQLKHVCNLPRVLWDI